MFRVAIGLSSASSAHGGNRIQEAQRLGCRPEQLLDASASLVPFPPSRPLRRCLSRALTDCTLRDYPDRSHHQLREAISHWHGVDPAMVLPGNGAAELFTWVARDAALQGVSGLPVPGFADYCRALRCWQGSLQAFPLPLSWTAEAPQPFPLRPAADVLWITNPHNPTGQLWSRASLEPLLERYRLVICDEAFLPLVPDGERQSLVPIVGEHSNLVVIRSLTKLFAVAGLRLGYAIGTQERLQRWQQWRDPWPLNGFAIAAGTALMTDRSALERWMVRVQEWVAREGLWMHAQLSDLSGIRPYPSAANFLLIRGDASLVRLREQMAQRRVLLRDCRSFAELGEHWLRIGLQHRSGNRRIVAAFRDLLR